MVLILLLLTTAQSQMFFGLTNKSDSTALDCKSYECVQNPPSDFGLLRICAEYKSSAGKYGLKKCDYPNSFENFCDTRNFVDQKAYCVTPQLEKTGLYPGEPCSQNKTCLSQYCQGDFCGGGKLGDSCSSNSECNHGLRCLGTCQPLIGLNQYGCHSDYDCINSCGCDKNSTGESGVCRPYFSIPIGQVVGSCVEYNSLLCEKGQCTNSTNSTYECVEPFVSRRNTECVSSSQCLSANSEVYSKCECGYNGPGNAYCQPFIGDSVGMDLLSSLKDWVQSNEILFCNTERRWSLDCAENWNGNDYDRLKYRYYAYKNFTHYQLNDECVKNIYTYDYWDSKKLYSEDSSVYLALVSAYFLI